MTGAAPSSPTWPAVWRERVLGAFLVLVTLLLPLKLGSIASPGEVMLIGNDVWSWLFGIWPPFLAPVLGGAALLLAVTLLPPPAWRWCRAWLLLPWGFFTLSLIPGLLVTTEWDAALMTLAHWLGVTAFAVAVWWAVQNAPRLRGWLLCAVATGTVLVAVAGWQQRVFGGLAETERQALLGMTGLRDLPLAQVPAVRANVLATAAARQDRGTRDLLDRLGQRRAFGPFAYPNSYAAHLILSLPLLLALAWGWGGRFAPTRVSRPLFVGAALILVGGALAMSESRAGILAFGLGLGISGFLLPLPGWRRWRWWVAGGFVLLALTGVWAAGVRSGRGLGTVAARGQYWRAAVLMVADEPLTGVGQGEFFPWYMRLIRPGEEETRQPHAMVLGYSAQGGLLCGAAALACVLLPFGIRLRRDPAMWTVLAAQAGLFAWGLHAQADFNSEIPGTVMLVAILPLLVAETADSATKPLVALRLGAVVLALASLVGGAWRWPGELRLLALQQRLAEPDTTLEQGAELAAQAAAALPWSPVPWSLLGAWQNQQRHPELAMHSYQELLLRTPHRGGYWLRLAATATAADDRATAAHALSQAQIWSPRSAAEYTARSQP